MPSLRDCLGLAGKLISPADAEAMHARAAQYRADGYPAEKAERMAVDWAATQADAALDGIYQQAGVKRSAPKAAAKRPAPKESPAPVAEPQATQPIAKPADDRAEYDRLQGEMTRTDPRSPEYKAVWQASEDIKNRHGGMPPGEAVGAVPVTGKPVTLDGWHATDKDVPSGELNPESWFSLSKDATDFYYSGPEHGTKINARVEMKNPLVVTDEEFRKTSHGPTWWAAKAAKEGHDGVILRDIQDGDRISTVFSPIFSPEREDAITEIGREGRVASPKSSVREPSISAPSTAESRANNAGIDLPPVSSLNAAQKLAELQAGGITTYAGKPIEDANPAQLSNALGKFRRGELTAEGEKPGATPAGMSERAIAALEKAKIDTKGKVFDATSGIPIAAYNAALDLAIVAIRAGRTVAEAVRLAVARYRAVHREATAEDVAKLTQAINNAASQPPEPPKPGKMKESKLGESLKAAGVPVESIEYQVRAQQERKNEAAAYIKANGPVAAEAALANPDIPGDTRVAIGGQLISERMLALRDAKGADTARITRDIQRITEKMRPELATEAGQTISMIGGIYDDIRVASGMEYVRAVQEARRKALGGEDAEAAATEAADAFNKAKTDEEKIAAIERLKERYTEKPVRRMLDQLKRMERVKELNSLGVLTRDDMVEVAGNALGIPGIDQAKLKHLAELADRVENAKNHAERTKATLELADTLGIYKGVSAMDLESSILTLNIMSGYTTQMGNLAGNSMQALSNLMSTAITNPTKAAQLAKGMLQGIPEGITQAKSILKTGRGSRDFQDKTLGAGNLLQTVDYARDFPKIPKAAADTLTARARLVDKIGRAMKAADAVFYYPAREAHARMTMAQLLDGKFSGSELDKMVDKYLHVTPEAFESANKQAAAEGYEGIDLARRASDIIEERRSGTPEGKTAVKESERFAAETTYNNEPVGLAGVFYRSAADLVGNAKVGGVPILKPWLMFLRVPTNVFNATTNYTPLGAVRAKLGVPSERFSRHNPDWKNFSAAERRRLYVQSLIGTSMMSAMLLKTLDDEEPVDVSASGPDNAAQKAQLMASGWRPYSVKVGDKYVSYRDTPLLMPLAIIGHVADAIRYKKGAADEGLEEKIAAAFGQAPQVIFQTSMLSNFADLMSGLSGKAGSPAAITRTLGSIPANLTIPYNRLFQQIDQTFDPKSYKSNPLLEAVPFARRTGEVQSDVQGRDRTYQPVSRFGGSESKDPLDKVLMDRNLYIPEAGKDTKLGDKAMTEEQLAAFRKLSGQRIRLRLTGMVPLLRTLDAERAQERIEQITRDERARAKAAVRGMSLSAQP